MKWVTYQDVSGAENVGVVSGDTIYAMPPGVTLLDLVARGSEGLRQAGQDAQRSPAAVAPLAEVRLLAPIPRPPSIRDSLCFLDHMRNCQAALGAGRTLGDSWYRIPAFYFACPATVLGPYDDAPTAPGSAWQDFELEIAAVIGTGAKISRSKRRSRRSSATPSSTTGPPAICSRWRANWGSGKARAKTAGSRWARTW